MPPATPSTAFLKTAPTGNTLPELGHQPRPNAALTLDFGREVLLDELRITERADFPHDNYWVKATVEFSDGSQLDIPLVKSAKPQSVAFEPKRVRSLVLKDLIQAEGTSPSLP